MSHVHGASLLYSCFPEIVNKTSFWKFFHLEPKKKKPPLKKMVPVTAPVVETSEADNTVLKVWVNILECPKICMFQSVQASRNHSDAETGSQKDENDSDSDAEAVVQGFLKWWFSVFEFARFNGKST